MNIYYVQRVDTCDYDEYDGFVVIAENIKEALSVAIDTPNGWTKKQNGQWDEEHVFFLGKYTGKEKYETGIVLSSFHAG
jgi:hypothetical protein